MNADEIEKLLETTLTLDESVTLSLQIKSLFVLVVISQLALLEFDIPSPMKEIVEELAREFEQDVINIHPEIGPLLNMGWNLKGQTDETR